MKKSAKKRVLIPAAVFAVIALIGYAVFAVLGNVLEAQKAAERFRGENEERFAQVSAFFPLGAGFDENGVNTVRDAMEQGFKDASLEPTENGSLYVDCYSAHTSIYVSGQRGSGTADVMAVGGDFFNIHQLRLRDGSYISGDDLMHDRVVLDEELAWRLFGGVELAGLTVEINEKPFVIAGVISREDDFASKRAYTDGEGMFMLYDTLNAMQETEISCYEAVLADPVKNFALNTVQSALEAYEPVPVENSKRFTVEGIIGVIGDFGERSMNTAGVIYPWWENAARLIEDYAALALFIALVFSVFPAVTAIAVAVGFIKRQIKKLPGLADRLVDDHRIRMYAKKLIEEEAAQKAEEDSQNKNE